MFAGTTSKLRYHSEKNAILAPKWQKFLQQGLSGASEMVATKHFFVQKSSNSSLNTHKKSFSNSICFEKGIRVLITVFDRVNKLSKSVLCSK